MNLFVSSIVVPATHLPITVAAAQESLAAAVVEEVERTILQRAIVRQTRRVVIDGPLASRLELEPVQAIVSLTRWTPSDPAAEVDAASYNLVSRDPAGAIVFPDNDWPAPERAIGSFALTYTAGWEVTDTTNLVPPSVQLMIERAIEFRAGGSGLEAIRIGPLEMDQAPSYRTDRLPRELTDIARGWAYRPGLFAARP